MLFHFIILLGIADFRAEEIRDKTAKAFSVRFKRIDACGSSPGPVVLSARPIADVSNSYRLKTRFTWLGTSMRSLRSRLLALWIMLVLSGAATAYLLFESF